MIVARPRLYVSSVGFFSLPNASCYDLASILFKEYLVWRRPEKDQAAATPGKSLYLMEWSQTTAGKPGQAGCDEAMQSKYIINQMCDIVAMGASRAFIYQLMDGTPHGNPTGRGGAESHFGICDYQWRVKPAVQALANVKNLLLDNNSKNFTADVPPYRVSGLTHARMARSSLSVSKSDGSTFIVVWSEPNIWDAKTSKPITPTPWPDNVTVDFGRSHTMSYRVYDPLVGLNPLAIGKASKEISKVALHILGSPNFLQVFPP